MSTIFFPFPAGAAHYTGILNQTARRIAAWDLADPELWAIFVDQFRKHPDDGNDQWRGEYWGKMMRGGCITCQYVPELYSILEASVRDLLSTAEPDGRISSYSREWQFRGWDLWGRKYVLLGLQYFLEICRDPTLAQEIVIQMQAQADSMLRDLKQAKLKLYDTSSWWNGINSVSILEPMVKLYKITEKKDYLDFAGQTVEEGGAKNFRLFEAPLRSNLPPSTYPVTKAYEMMSCFEGLLEYGKVTGKQECIDAAVSLGKNILRDEISVIGCAGCTHELFDGAGTSQFDPEKGKGIMQETCVTVTWLRFCLKLLEQTGDPIFADAMEASIYNGLLGAVNTRQQPFIDRNEHRERAYSEEHLPEIYPFDSYSPLTAGSRGVKQAGCRPITPKRNYSCCAAIAAAGTGLAVRIAALNTKKGPAILFYEPGLLCFSTPEGQEAQLNIHSSYPAEGAVVLTLSLPRPEKWELRLRIPSYSQQTELRINSIPVPTQSGWVLLDRRWQDKDRVELTLDMTIRPLRSVQRTDRKHSPYFCLQKGPLILALDTEFNRVDLTKPQPIPTRFHPVPPPVSCLVSLSDGQQTWIDYASAGKSWDPQKPFACWIPEEK